MRELTPDERKDLVAALGDSFPARWETFELSVQIDGARVDDEGDVLLPWMLAWSSVDGAVLAAEGRKALLHLVDLEEDPLRARAYFRALVACLPGIAALRGLLPGEGLQLDGDPFAGTPSPPLLEDLSLQTFEQFEERLTRAQAPDDTDGAESRPDPSDLSGTEPIAFDPEQEAELATWPAARWPFVRYARWLAERGDPRGARMAADFGAEDRDPRTRRFHARRSSHVLAQHRWYFLGPFAGDDREPYGEEVLFTWDLGFVRRIDLFLGLDASGPPPVALLRAALALPSSRLATTLVLEVAPRAFEVEERHALPRWTELLVASGGHRHLRSIEIARSPALADLPYFFPVEGPAILVEPEDVEAIRTAFPKADVRATRSLRSSGPK